MRSNRGRSAVYLFAIVTLVGLIVIAVVLRPAGTAGPCRVEHAAALPDLPEASGLAVSRRHPGIIWSHNDSGNDTVLFALDSSGQVRGRVRVPIEMRDWEDVSAGRCPAGSCLYLADIGDNRQVRRQIRIVRVPEPAL